MSANGVSARLAAFAAELRLESVPVSVRERARLLLLDCLGNIVRAHAAAESTPAVVAAINALGLAEGQARVFGDDRTYAPAGAALLNATLAHSLDFDDTHAAAVVHPSAPIVPAAFAAAELADRSGEDLLAGMIAGYEVALRLALALPAAAHYDRGFHPSATCGAFGAAAAAARVLGLNCGRTLAAFGVVLSQVSGSLQFLANGAWTKRFQVGWASLSGLTAAVLAREGFVGAAEPIEGKQGFLHAYAPNPDMGRAAADLGEVWELMATGVKPYPSCRWGHAGIDAALALRAEHNLEGREVEQATYGLPRSGMLLVGEPAEKKANPTNTVDAQFSAPFVIACALLNGHVGWDDYARLGDPDLQALMQRISCQPDAELEARCPGRMAGRLTLHARGQEFSRTVIAPKGEPENFPTGDELLAKFAGLAGAVLGEERTRRLAERAGHVDRLGRARDLWG